MSPLPLPWEMGFYLAMSGKVTGAERSTNFTWTSQFFFRILLYTNYWEKIKIHNGFKWVLSDFSVTFYRKASRKYW